MPSPERRPPVPASAHGRASALLERMRTVTGGSGDGSAARSAAPAMVIGGLLRAGWIVWTATAPFAYDNPATQNIRLAEQLAQLQLPRFDGDLTAHFSYGYPLLLAPLGVFARLTGVSIFPTALALNLVISIVTIALAGLLARRLLGPDAAGPARWLVATAPPLIIASSIVSSATLTIGLIAAALLASPRPGSPPGPARNRAWVIAGVLAGVTTLVTPIGLLVFPGIVLVSASGRNDLGPAVRGILRGGVVPLVALTLFQGTTVGVWAPVPTRVAVVACLGHGDRPTTSWDPSPAYERPECYRSRLFRADTALGTRTAASPPDAPDEADWFRVSSGRILADVVLQPHRTVASVVRSTIAAGRDVEAPLVLSEDLGSQPHGNERFHDLAGRIIRGWETGVLLLGALTVFRLRRRARRASFLVLLTLIPVWVGPSPGTTIGPLVFAWCILAAGFVGTVADDTLDVGQDHLQRDVVA